MTAENEELEELRKLKKKSVAEISNSKAQSILAYGMLRVLQEDTSIETDFGKLVHLITYALAKTEALTDEVENLRNQIIQLKIKE